MAESIVDGSTALSCAITYPFVCQSEVVTHLIDTVLSSNWASCLLQPLLAIINHLLNLVAAIRPSQWCILVYLTIGVGALVNATTPKSFRDKLMGYGPRVIETGSKSNEVAMNPIFGALWQILGYTGLTSSIPHAWFTHFYVILTAANLFWAMQIYTGGDVIKRVIDSELQGSTYTKSTPKELVVVAMVMLVAHGIRRLLECLFVQKQSPSSRMLLLHWFLTFAFYNCVSMSAWISGSASIRDTDFRTIDVIAIIRDSPHLARITSVVPIFILASYNQFQAHCHLAGLVKYTLPSSGLFQYIVCPHYFCECVIYACFVFICAPEGHIVNTVFLAALFATISNLGVTSKNTRVWYQEKFGQDCVKERWNIIPFVY